MGVSLLGGPLCVSLKAKAASFSAASVPTLFGRVRRLGFGFDARGFLARHARLDGSPLRGPRCGIRLCARPRFRSGAEFRFG